MERKLPIVDIAGTSFVVDVVSRELRQVDKPKNRLYFDNFEYQEEKYVFLFDHSRKKEASPTSRPENVRKIELPHMVALDPQAMAEKYDVPIESLAGKSDRAIMYNNYDFIRRKGGKLPTIDIAGDKYKVEILKDRLTLTNDPAVWISLSKLDLSKDGERYAFFYDTNEKKALQGLSMDITEIPKGVVFMEIPNQYALDQIGWIQRYHQGFDPFNGGHPFDKVLVGRVVPYSETGIPKLIENNLREKAKKVEKKRSVKRGKGN